MKTVWLITITIAASLLAAGIILLLSRPIHGKAVVLQPPPTALPLLIHVTGAVGKPGVVSIPPNSRVQDAIQAAGGLLPEADAGALNLVAPLEDGQRLLIPFINQESDASSPQEQEPTSNRTTVIDIDSSSVTATAQWPININTATQEELESLPEIGPVTAAKIIEYRTLNGIFPTIEDIQKVKGIGPKTYEAIKDLITVDMP